MVFDNVVANETHIITVSADGYEPFSAMVMVEKDLIAKVDVSLQPIRGGMTPLTTVPTTATQALTTAPLTTAPLTTATVPPTMPTARSGLDAVPVLGALVLCGAIALLRNNRQ
jgi:hypothetical protein